MVRKKNNISERDLICESLLNKSFEKGKEISGFSGFKIEVINGQSNSFTKKTEMIFVKLENGIITEAK